MNLEKGFRNILFVRTDRMGDVILTTPAIKAAREAYPKARLSILVSPSTQDLVIGNPCLDEVLVDHRCDDHKGVNFLKLVGLIRRKKFDCALILHTKRRTNLLCFLAGIPRRIGFKNNKFGTLLTDPLEDKRHLGEKHEAEYCLDVLKPLGIKEKETELFVPIQKNAQEWLNNLENKKQIQHADRLIAFHAGASDPSKCWPEKRFAEVINFLLNKTAGKIVLIGDRKTKDISQKICSLVSGPILDLTAQTTVGQLAALLKRCCLLVSNDSGPVHVASAFGTAVVSIFTRNQPGINPERWRPLAANAKVVCVPPGHRDDLNFTKAGVVEEKYLEIIPAQAVLEAVDGLLKLC